MTKLLHCLYQRHINIIIVSIINSRVPGIWTMVKILSKIMSSSNDQ